MGAPTFRAERRTQEAREPQEPVRGKRQQTPVLGCPSQTPVNQAARPPSAAEETAHSSCHQEDVVEACLQQDGKRGVENKTSKNKSKIELLLARGSWDQLHPLFRPKVNANQESKFSEKEHKRRRLKARSFSFFS